jgi:hypothetical protein
MELLSALLEPALWALAETAVLPSTLGFISPLQWPSTQRAIYILPIQARAEFVRLLPMEPSALLRVLEPPVLVTIGAFPEMEGRLQRLIIIFLPAWQLTLRAGTDAVYDLTLSSINEFSGNMSFNCSSLPANASCTINPATMPLSSSESKSLTVTIKTTARTRSVAAVVLSSSHWESTVPVLFSMTILGIMYSMPKRRRLVLTMAGVLCATALSGCGSAGKNTGAKTQPSTTVSGTPAGTYTVQLRVSGDIAIIYNLTLTVQ